MKLKVYLHILETTVWDISLAINCPHCIIANVLDVSGLSRSSVNATLTDLGLTILLPQWDPLIFWNPEKYKNTQSTKNNHNKGT